MIHIKHKYISKGILCFLCFFVAISFFATLVPIASASHEGMPCCVGKEAGHCDSGITAKEVLPPSEPMCGLDSITIVAGPSHKEVETTSHAAKSTSVSKPCQMECGACASASSRQQKRERAIAESKGRYTPSSSSVSRVEDLPIVFTSIEDWSRINPRGPPVR